MRTTIVTTSQTRRSYTFETDHELSISEAMDLIDSVEFHERADVLVDVDEPYGEELSSVYVEADDLDSRSER